MSLETTINVAGRFPNTEQAARDLQSPELMSSVGNAIAAHLKQWFITLNSERTHGYRQPGFYEEAAASTGYTTDYGFPAVVVMKKGVAQRRFGGRIEPKHTKYLAIPNSFSSMISETYGKSPMDFGNLDVVWGRRKDGTIGPIGLKGHEDDTDDDEQGAYHQTHVFQRQRGGSATRDGKRGEYVPYGKRGKDLKGSSGEVLFWLAQWVDQQPDPTVLPNTEDLAITGERAMVQWLAANPPITIAVEGASA